MPTRPSIKINNWVCATRRSNGKPTVTCGFFHRFFFDLQCVGTPGHSLVFLYFSLTDNKDFSSMCVCWLGHSFICLFIHIDLQLGFLIRSSIQWVIHLFCFLFFWTAIRILQPFVSWVGLSRFKCKQTRPL